MKTLFIITILSFFGLKSFAFDRTNLQTGDVLLISLNCYECRMIESETDSAFSHSGVVVIDENNRVRIAQSLGRLDHFSIDDFKKNITPGTALSVYRPREFTSLAPEKLKLLQKNMLDIFKSNFRGAPFDSDYEWNNFNSNGVELLYCSEFIAKFLDFFLSKKTIPAPLSYIKHHDYWMQYFKGHVPDNVLGNSPASFSRDSRFVFVGKIY